MRERRRGPGGQWTPRVTAPDLRCLLMAKPNGAVVVFGALVLSSLFSFALVVGGSSQRELFKRDLARLGQDSSIMRHQFTGLDRVCSSLVQTYRRVRAVGKGEPMTEAGCSKQTKKNSFQLLMAQWIAPHW